MTYPLVFLVSLLQQPTPLVGPAQDLLPAQTDAHQQVLDVDGVLLAPEVLQVGPRAVKRGHALRLRLHVLPYCLQRTCEGTVSVNSGNKWLVD